MTVHNVEVVACSDKYSLNFPSTLTGALECVSGQLCGFTAPTFTLALVDHHHSH